MLSKGKLGLVGILLAALLGAYASSMTTTGGFQFNNVTNTGSLIILADTIVVSDGPPSTIMSITVFEDTPVVVMYNAKVVITNLCQRISVSGKTLEINATSAEGTGVTMYITKMISSATGPAIFEDLEITDLPTFNMTMGGTVTLTDVEIHAVYMFADTMTLIGMELTVYE